MQAVIIATITTLVGIIVTILITRHYYGRSSKHRLAIYEFPFPEMLSGVDPDTRRGLTIKFHDKDVVALSVIEFLVANEGAYTIRDTISPLSATVDEKCQIVDGSITYVYPEGREVALEVISDHQFKCLFPLLNPGEYFYIKLITDGHVRRRDIRFTISADGLPPRIDVESGARVDISSGHDSGFDFGLAGFSLVILLIGLSLGLPVVALYRARPHDFPFAWSHFHFIWWLTIPLAVATIASAILVILAFVMLATAIFGNIPRRPRFRRPGRYNPHFYGYGIPVGPFEIESAAARYPRDDEQPTD
jgi:uncharacterized membrane protein YhaH (DUF805 family)